MRRQTRDLAKGKGAIGKALLLCLGPRVLCVAHFGKGRLGLFEQHADGLGAAAARKVAQHGRLELGAGRLAGEEGLLQQRLDADA